MEHIELFITAKTKVFTFAQYAMVSVLCEHTLGRIFTVMSKQKDNSSKPTKQEKKLHFGSSSDGNTGARRTIVNGKVTRNEKGNPRRS